RPAGNWSGGVIADGADHTANFTTAGLTGAITINLDTPRTIGALVFDNPSNTFGWTISGPNVLTLSKTGTPTIAVNNASITATISVPLAGTQGFTFSGPGTLALAANSTLTGPITVASGNLNVNATISAPVTV